MSRLPAIVKEVRFLLCSSGAKSEGLRSFVKSQYPKLKNANPRVPMLIRECTGTPARIAVRFDRGVERIVSVDGKNASEIETSIQSVLSSTTA